MPVRKLAAPAPRTVVTEETDTDVPEPHTSNGKALHRAQAGCATERAAILAAHLCRRALVRWCVGAWVVMRPLCSSGQLSCVACTRPPPKRCGHTL